MTTTKRCVGPDPKQQVHDWSTLYRAGGWCAFLYLVVSLAAPALLITVVNPYNLNQGRALSGSEMLEMVSEHRTWWMLLQALTLEGSIFAIVTFLALFVALRQVSPGWALIGAATGVVSMVLYMAYYPVLLGIVWLSDEWTKATGPRQSHLEAAAEALIAQNSAFNPVYEPLTALGIGLLSIAMLRSSMPHWIGWLGIATFVVALAAVGAYPVIGLHYFWWWLLFVAWFLAVGWQLLKWTPAPTR